VPPTFRQNWTWLVAYAEVALRQALCTALIVEGHRDADAETDEERWRP